MKKLVLAALIALAGTPALAAGPVLITGAGATFPYPLYSKWFSEYNKLHPDIRFNYQSIGSGGGIQQFTAGTVDFGATDAPMTEAEQAKAAGRRSTSPPCSAPWSSPTTRPVAGAQPHARPSSPTSSSARSRSGTTRRSPP